MSPSWRDTLRVAFSPHHVGLVRRRRGRPEVAAGRLVACGAPAPDEAPWVPALAALAAAMAEGQRRGLAVTVVLSNHFVRYQLVPWNDQIKGAAEALAHARHGFERVYGAAAAAWDIRLSPGDDGAPGVASAVDPGLLAGLDQATAAAGLRLGSVQPYLMAAFNRWRRELAGPAVSFVLAEPGRLCLATLGDGRWYDLVNQRSGPDWVAALPDLVARRRLLCGQEGPGRVCLYAPDPGAETALRGAGETVRDLRPPLPAAALPYEMALNG